MNTKYAYKYTEIYIYIYIYIYVCVCVCVYISINGIIKPLQTLIAILEEIPSEISNMVKHIHQQSTTGKLPQALTITLAIQIYKKGKKNKPVNYRPISLICILCKVMENIILNYLWKHVTANNIILHNQHGFQTGLSCKTQLVEAVHDWALTPNNRKGNKSPSSRLLQSF